MNAGDGRHRAGSAEQMERAAAVALLAQPAEEGGQMIRHFLHHVAIDIGRHIDAAVTLSQRDDSAGQRNPVASRP